MITSILPYSRRACPLALRESYCSRWHCRLHLAGQTACGQDRPLLQDGSIDGGFEIGRSTGKDRWEIVRYCFGRIALPRGIGFSQSWLGQPCAPRSWHNCRRRGCLQKGCWPGPEAHSTIGRPDPLTTEATSNHLRSVRYWSSGIACAGLASNSCLIRFTWSEYFLLMEARTSSCDSGALAFDFASSNTVCKRPISPRSLSTSRNCSFWRPFGVVSVRARTLQKAAHFPHAIGSGDLACCCNLCVLIQQFCVGSVLQCEWSH